MMGLDGLALRGGILLALGLLACGMVLAGRRYVEQRRRRVLEMEAPPIGLATPGDVVVRILAFSTAGGRQWRAMRGPALRRVVEARDVRVVVLEVDARSSSELAQRYGVLTLPTTVVLDSTGRARAINYGFANSAK